MQSILPLVLLLSFNEALHVKSRFNEKFRTKDLTIEQYPFLAVILLRPTNNVLIERFQCVGSIITSKWVLTAAQCIHDFEENYDEESLYIATGNVNFLEGNKHDILFWHHHETFDSESNADDVGLIKIKDRFEAKNEKPIKLVARDYTYPTSTEVIIVGWSIDFGEIPLFRDSHVHIINHTDCIEMFIDRIEVQQSKFCAFESRTCAFNFGGPILDNNVLIGMLSFGDGCVRGPSIYTKLSFYRNWIDKARIKFLVPPFISQNESTEECCTKSYQDKKRSSSETLVNYEQLLLWFILLIEIVK